MQYDFLKNVVFLRHGETEWNTKKMIQGWLDSSLTEKGIQQARDVIPVLAQYDFKKIVSSSADRAFQTAQIIAGALKISDVKINANFAERNFGTMEGMTKDQAKEKFPELWDENNHFILEKETVDGETIEHIYQRCQQGFFYLQEIAQAQKILVITHDSFLKFFLSYITGVSIKETKNRDFPHTEPIVFS